MARPYTKRAMIERIKRHMNNGFTNSSFGSSDNEILYFIDQSLATAIVGLAYANAKVEGVLVTPEAFLVTYRLSGILQDDITGNWYVDLPQPPLSLPLGYSVTDAYYGQAGYGKSDPIMLVKVKRRPYRKFMPSPDGVQGWVENKRFWMEATDGTPLSNMTLFIQMPSTRTEDLDEDMAVADDVLDMIFTNVVAKLTQREQLPSDIIQDNLPAGNKSS